MEEIDDNDLLEWIYDYDKLEGNQIRLLEILPGDDEELIECRSRTVSLEQTEGGTSLESPVLYTALSYVWGTEPNDTFILVNGKFLLVNPNVKVALIELRKASPKITPENNAEKVKSLEALTRHVKYFSERLGTVSEEEAEDEMEYVRAMLDESYRGIDDLTKISKETDQAAGENAPQEIDGDGVGENSDKPPMAELNQVPSSSEDTISITEELNGLELSNETSVEPNPRVSAPSYAPRLLWIDAICINQNDDEEKSAQILLMGSIYQNAFILLIWLGVPDETTEALFTEFTPAEELESNQTPDKIAKQEKQTQALVKFFQHPWFTRVWVKQEYIFGSSRFDDHILVQYGPYCIRNFIQTALITLPHLEGISLGYQPPGIGHLAGLGSATDMVSDRMYSPLGTLSGVAEKTEYTPKSGGEYFLTRVSHSLKLGSTDPRDRIYSILGLLQAVLSKEAYDVVTADLLIDYSASVEEIYCSFVKTIVHCTKRLDILCFSTGYRPNEVKRALWCPDWSMYKDSFHLGPLAAHISLSVHFRGSYDDTIPFNATPGISSKTHFTEDGRGLIAVGILWDTVATEPIQGVPEKSSSNDQKRIFGRSTIKMLEDLAPSQDNHRIFLEAMAVNSEISNETLERFKSWAGQVPSEDFVSEETGTEQDELPYANLMSMNAIFTRRHNIVRPFNNKTKIGDEIAIIYGCATPLILRPYEKFWIIMGEVYVPGIMHGEAFLSPELERKEQFFGFV